MIKKILAFAMAIGMLLSLAACGGEETPPVDAPKATEQNTEPKQTTAPIETEPAIQLSVHENTFFTVAYSEEDGWSLAEDDIYAYDGGGNAHVRILNEEGNTEIVVSIYAEKKDPESFRKALYVNGFDLKAYASGAVETTDVGGQAMLYVDQSNGDRFFFGRNEAAGVSYTIDATNWEDPRVPALVAGITCTASGTDNIDPPWSWEGEPFHSETMSQMIGTHTVTGEFLAMSEPLTTFETFKHDVEVIGDKVYLLSDYVLREYALEGTGLTYSREIPLDDDYEVVESADGTLVLSSFMRPVIGHDGNAVLYSYEGPDKFTLAPDGTWGISWFSSGKTCEKFTFRDGALVGEEFPFQEVKNIRQLCIDSSYIYVSGSPAEGSGHTVFVYDHSGALQMQLLGDPNSSIGLGSISFVAKVGNAILALDGNMRDLVLWTADGTWIGSVDAEDLFGTYYPWMASADVLPDGSILVVMTEDRADDSAMEALVFRVTVS
jgi:predicted small lipoprotein YifL